MLRFVFVLFCLQPTEFHSLFGFIQLVVLILQDICKTVKQMNYCYSKNRRATHPLQFHVTSFKGPSKDEIQKYTGYTNWDVSTLMYVRFYIFFILYSEVFVYLRRIIKIELSFRRWIFTPTTTWGFSKKKSSSIWRAIRKTSSGNWKRTRCTSLERSSTIIVTR
jgi:hypothetical protein